MDVAVETQHVEEDIHGENFLTGSMVQLSFLGLLVLLVALEEGGAHINKVERFLEFALLCEHLKVEADEFLIDLKIWLFHQLEQQQVSNVQDFCLES